MTEKKIKVSVYQQDWIPGFAAFLSDGTLKEQTEPHAEIVLNVGATLALLKEKSISKEDVPYIIMEHVIHELTHVLEEWCGVEFNEDRVEDLILKYSDYSKEKAKDNDRIKKS